MIEIIKMIGIHVEGKCIVPTSSLKFKLYLFYKNNSEFKTMRMRSVNHINTV